MNNIELMVDWFRAISKKQSYLEFLLILNLSIIWGLVLSTDEATINKTIGFAFLGFIFWFTKWAYKKYSTWRAFRQADAIKQMIIKNACDDLQK